MPQTLTSPPFITPGKIITAEKSPQKNHRRKITAGKITAGKITL